MSIEIYSDDALIERYDDVARTYTAWDAEGVQIEQRPYTAEEDAEADVRAAERTERENAQQVEEAFDSAMDDLQQILDAPSMTNAQALAAIKALARILRKVLRYIRKDFTGVE